MKKFVDVQKCGRCGHEWPYEGTKDPNSPWPIRASCSMCHTTVILKTEEVSV